MQGLRIRGFFTDVNAQANRILAVPKPIPFSKASRWSRGEALKPLAIALLLFTSLYYTRACRAQDTGDFHPATTNVWGAE